MSQDGALDPYRSPTPAPLPTRRRRPWGWLAAGVAWALFSVTAAAFLATRTLDPVARDFAHGFSDGFSDGFSSGPARPGTSTASTQPSPSESVPEITVSRSAHPFPSVAITGKDPRPAAAAAWNAANAYYGTGDVTHYCPMYGFGRSYIYNDLKECVDYTGTEIAKISVGDRKDIGATRIEPDAMVVLADHSVVFRESDKSWPTHPDWGYDDTSVIVMHLVPHQGWRVVGYVDTTDATPVTSGYVPAGVS